MKTYLLAFLVLFTGFSAMAQKKFTEGTILYDIVINTGSDKPQNADFFDGATNAVYIKGSKSRTEMTSSLGTQSTIIDANSNAVTILKEFGEQKYMINMNGSEWKDANRKFEGVTFTFSDESRVIMGYASKK